MRILVSIRDERLLQRMHPPGRGEWESRMVLREVPAAEVDSLGSGSDSGCNGSIRDQTTANEAETAVVGFEVPCRSYNG